MGETALKAARAVGYQSAGTVEFLLTGARSPSADRGAGPSPVASHPPSEAETKREFFFLEMNTRLQVEHPVTEMVTGLDLVREQIRIAAGEPLGYAQKDVRIHGAAIEVRLNAEDTTNAFLPSTGTVQNLRMPGGPGIRLDLGLYRGMEVGVDYDPLLAKLVAWGETRDLAIARMIRALQELNVGGVRTSAPAALAVLEDPRFKKGEFDTHFLESLDLRARHGGEDETVAAASAIWRHHLARRRGLSTSSADRSAWLARSRSSRSAHRSDDPGDAGRLRP
jgi:acetyl-CoA carboxylase biotin carboxylase subunit